MPGAGEVTHLWPRAAARAAVMAPQGQRGASVRGRPPRRCLRRAWSARAASLGLGGVFLGGMSLSLDFLPMAGGGEFAATAVCLELGDAAGLGGAAVLGDDAIALPDAGAVWPGAGAVEFDG